MNTSTVVVVYAYEAIRNSKHWSSSWRVSLFVCLVCVRALRPIAQYSKRFQMVFEVSSVTVLERNTSKAYNSNLSDVNVAVEEDDEVIGEVLGGKEGDDVQTGGE